MALLLQPPCYMVEPVQVLHHLPEQQDHHHKNSMNVGS